jgi:hypothetical protein
MKFLKEVVCKCLGGENMETTLSPLNPEFPDTDKFACCYGRNAITDPFFCQKELGQY